MSPEGNLKPSLKRNLVGIAGLLTAFGVTASVTQIGAQETGQESKWSVPICGRIDPESQAFEKMSWMRSQVAYYLNEVSSDENVICLRIGRTGYIKLLTEQEEADYFATQTATAATPSPQPTGTFGRGYMGPVGENAKE